MSLDLSVALVFHWLFAVPQNLQHPRFDAARILGVTEVAFTAGLQL